jgi:hypothetical protein
MRAQLDELLAMCAEIGATVESIAEDAVPGIPPSLIAAARSAPTTGEPLLITFPEGGQVIAVVGGHGNPASWWAQIRGWKQA